MQYGQRYRIKLHSNDQIVEGECIQTRGDDENFPTFIVDGMAIGVHKDRVLGLVDDDCPVDGIERPAFTHREIWGWDDPLKETNGPVSDG
jgi:hypothetical protein